MRRWVPVLLILLVAGGWWFLRHQRREGWERYQAGITALEGHERLRFATLPNGLPVAGADAGFLREHHFTAFQVVEAIDAQRVVLHFERTYFSIDVVAKVERVVSAELTEELRELLEGVARVERF